MPTERFYRLPEAKKQVIRQAAIKEFARVPFEKASINQIIQNADISRGSFYTYFEDKQDVVRYIFEDNARQMQECCERELDKNDGNLFDMLEWLFEFTIRKLEESKEMVQLVRNVCSYQENTRAMGFEIGYRPPMGSPGKEKTTQWLAKRIRMERFARRSEEELDVVLQLGVTSLILAVRFYYEQPDQLDQIRKRYLDSLEVIKQKSIENVDMLKGLNFVAIISLMGWGLGYFGQPHILARFMAADSHHSIVHARRISMTWMILCLAGAVAVGFFGIAYFNNNPAVAGAVNQNAERVFIELAQILFNPWIAGILLSAILAAVMSTLSCQLLVCSSAITEDLYKAFLRKNAGQKELEWVGRFMVLLVALIAIALAANPENRVLGLVSYAWAGFGAAFGPVVLFSVMWSRMTRNGALAGMIIGALTVIIWKQFGWLGLYEIIPGFIFGSLGIVVFSLLGKAPSAEMQRRFAEADAHYHSAPPVRATAE